MIFVSDMLRPVGVYAGVVGSPLQVTDDREGVPRPEQAWISTRGPAAVHGQDVPGHVTGRGASQEQQWTIQLLHRRDPPSQGALLGLTPEPRVAQRPGQL